MMRYINCKEDTASIKKKWKSFFKKQVHQSKIQNIWGEMFLSYTHQGQLKLNLQHAAE